MKALIAVMVMLGTILIAACCVDAQAQTAPEEGAELLTNPTFASGGKGWVLRGAVSDPQQGPNGGPVMRLAAVKPGTQALSVIGAQISPVPSDRQLRFTCYVKGATGNQSVMVNAFAYGKGDALLDNFSKQVALSAGRWQLYSADYVVPTGTTSLAIWVINNTPGKEMLISDAHLNVGRPQQAALKSLNGPGIIHAYALAAVRAEKEGATGTVTFPIPGIYRDQTPLSFTVTTEPAAALKSYRWLRRPDGINWLCEVTVSPPKRGAIVKWEADVLVGERKAAPLPKAQKPVAPPEAIAWTHSTACVQSADPAIKVKAAALAQGAPDVESYVKRVIAFTSTNQGTGAPFDALDARRALDCGGSCTNRANLAAALLRAHGIPARTLSHLPTWAPKLYEHWLIEYWHPGVGWVWAESTLGKFQPQPWTLAVLSVSNPDDENRAFDPLHLRYVMPGAAYLSVCELSKELVAADLVADDATNQAIPKVRMEGSDTELAALYATARSAFEVMAQAGATGRLQSATPQLQAAIQSGKAIELTAALGK